MLGSLWSHPYGAQGSVVGAWRGDRFFVPADRLGVEMPKRGQRRKSYVCSHVMKEGRRRCAIAWIPSFSRRNSLCPQTSQMQVPAWISWGWFTCPCKTPASATSSLDLRGRRCFPHQPGSRFNELPPSCAWFLCLWERFSGACAFGTRFFRLWPGKTP